MDFILLFIFPAIVISTLIARLSHLIKKYDLIVMISLIVVIWGGFILSIFFSRALESDQSNPTELLRQLSLSFLITTSIIIPLILLGQFLANRIARRYAPSVADALAAIITGSLASSLTPLVSIYLFFFVFQETENRQILSLSEIIGETFLPVFLLLSTTTGVVAWMIMGIGSMSTLRRRKGTIVGLISVGMSILLSSILSIGIAQFHLQLYGNIFLFAGISSVCIVFGMVTAGLMSGVLVNISAFFDFFSLLLAFALILYIQIEGYEVLKPYSAWRSEYYLYFIFGLGLIQLHTWIIGQKIIAGLHLIVLAVPFVSILALLSVEYNLDLLQIASLGILYVVFVTLISQIGIRLRHVKYAGILIVTLFTLIFFSGLIGYIYFI